MKRLILPLILIAGLVHAFANSPELGTVKWERDLDTGLAAAKKSGKPVFLLFQEVPG